MRRQPSCWRVLVCLPKWLQVVISYQFPWFSSFAFPSFSSHFFERCKITIKGGILCSLCWISSRFEIVQVLLIVFHRRLLVPTSRIQQRLTIQLRLTVQCLPKVCSTCANVPSKICSLFAFSQASEGFQAICDCISVCNSIIDRLEICIWSVSAPGAVVTIQQGQTMCSLQDQSDCLIHFSVCVVALLACCDCCSTYRTPMKPCYHQIEGQ